MKDLYIVANWKENKTEEDAVSFLDKFANTYEPRSNVTVIICPPFLSVSEVANLVNSNGIAVKVGVQDISMLPEGAHTGEVSAAQAAEFCEYAIIGHSERRNLGESDEDVAKKIELARENKIEPIVCVVNESVPVPKGVKIVAYEPVEAIGTGNPDTPENAQKVALTIKSKNPDIMHVLYGGSVVAENVHSFCEMDDLDGVLVGGASLDPDAFSSIIKNA